LSMGVCTCMYVFLCLCLFVCACVWFCLCVCMHVYSGLEDIELALYWLETAYQDREVDLIWLKVEPQFENLWEEPRFQAIIKAMGFPE